MASEAPTLRPGLRTRLTRAFGLYALVLATIYTLHALFFAYTVEDEFLDRDLRQIAATLTAEHEARGDWPEPLPPGISLHRSAASFPAEIRASFEQEPGRREFFGQAGRHYHLLRFPHAGEDGWLLAEVSDRLVFRQMRREVVVLLAGTAGLALILALLLAMGVARRTTAGLSALSAEVERLDPDALPRELPALPGLDDAELAILRRGLDRLLQRVADSLDREQSFTRDVSHELRTPLAVIVASAEALSRAETPAETRSAALARLGTASVQLGETLDALLALARVPPRSEAQGTPLLAAVEQVIVEQAARRPREDLALDLQIPAAHRTTLRPALLRILLANLIGNAFAHAAAGPLRIELREGRCTIRNRIPREPESGEPGLGLGLSILRRLDERYRLGLSVRVEAGWMVAGFDCASIPPDARGREAGRAGPQD